MTGGYAFITDDAALHRAFRKVDPYELDPVDWQLLDGKSDVLNLEQVANLGTAKLQSMERPPMLPPGDVELTPAMFEKLSRSAPEGYQVCRASIEPVMSTTMAALVRQLRVAEGLSYRALARWFAEGGLIVVDHQVPANQLVGMAIVDVAAAYCGEDFRRPPWNVYP